MYVLRFTRTVTFSPGIKRGAWRGLEGGRQSPRFAATAALPQLHPPHITPHRLAKLSLLVCQSLSKGMDPTCLHTLPSPTLVSSPTPGTPHKRPNPHPLEGVESKVNSHSFPNLKEGSPHEQRNQDDELQPNPRPGESMSDICAPDQAAHVPTNPFLLYPLLGLLQQHWTRLRHTLLL